jgi:hypothetical protein
VDPDERLILFEQRQAPLSLESLTTFREIGIRTVMIHCQYTSWHEIEPSPGTYNWDVPDRIVDRATRAGLKIVLNTYWRAPDWLEGTITRPGINVSDRKVFHTHWCAVNPFDERAMAAEARFVRKVCERYSSPSILCRYGMPYSAERLLPRGLWPYTEEQCIEVMLSRQRIFAEYGTELWTSLHPGPALGFTSVDGHTPEKVGNEHLWVIHDTLVREFPHHTINRFITEYFLGHGPWPCAIGGVKTWVGAQYVRGVVENAGRIGDWDVWGLIMGFRGTSIRDTGEPPRQPADGDFAQVARAIEILT